MDEKEKKMCKTEFKNRTIFYLASSEDGYDSRTPVFLQSALSLLNLLQTPVNHAGEDADGCGDNDKDDEEPGK